MYNEVKLRRIVREYGWSAMITFVSAFVGFLAISPMPVDKAGLWALAFSALRAGIAALINLGSTRGKTISSAPVTN